MRTTRTVALTDADQRLLENAGAAVEQALESLKTATARPDEVTGRVRLSVPAVAASLVIARSLPILLGRFPKVQVEVQVENRFVNTNSRTHQPAENRQLARRCEAPASSLHHVPLDGFRQADARVEAVG